jgi:protein TonB
MFGKSSPNPVSGKVQLALVASRLKAAAAVAAKFTVCLSIGSIVAALLFRLDAELVSQPKHYDTKRTSVQMLDFVRTVPEDYTRFKERRLPKKPPPPDKPPPPPKLRVNNPDKMDSAQTDMDLPDIELGFGDGGGPYLGQWRGGRQGNVDSDVIPIVRIAPQYPREALMKGIEGWVELEFVINSDGTVTNPVILGASPAQIFNRSAMRAILRWKFKPRFVDGRAVSRRGRQIIEYKLEEI